MGFRSQNTQQYWVVTCPVSRIIDGASIWRQWFREGIVAAGFPPAGHCEEGAGPYSLDDNPTESKWALNQECLRQMKVGDKIVPFLLERRIGPVATIRALHVQDKDWRPTVPVGVYEVGEGRRRHVTTVRELGRRIEVEWQTQNMPPEGKVVLVNPGEVVSRPTIRPLSEREFVRYTNLLGNRQNWVPL